MPTKRRTSAIPGGKRDHGRHGAAGKSRAKGRRNSAAGRPLPRHDSSAVRGDPQELAGVAAAAGPRGVDRPGTLLEAGRKDSRHALILGASGSALLMADRLSLCLHLSGDCTADEAQGLELDERINRGDSTVSYDVIGQAIDELAAWRDALGEVLIGAETLARISALKTRKEQRGC